MIYLGAGHHNYDPGAAANGYQENKLTIELRDMIASEIKRLYPGSELSLDDDSETLSQYLNRINTNDSDVVLEIHFDAFNGKAKGSTALISDNHNQISKDMARELVDYTSSILGTLNRGVKTESESARGKLGLTRKPGSTVLMEIEFIDNIDAMNGYHEQKHLLATKYAEILVKYDNLKD